MRRSAYLQSIRAWGVSFRPIWANSVDFVTRLISCHYRPADDGVVIIDIVHHAEDVFERFGDL